MVCWRSDVLWRHYFVVIELFFSVIPSCQLIFVVIKMLPDFISFRKSLDQRKMEYEQFYSSQETCSSVYRLWAYNLDCAIDHNQKFQALWQMSEESCLLFRTLYPTTVVVTVSIKMQTEKPKRYPSWL